LFSFASFSLSIDILQGFKAHLNPAETVIALAASGTALLTGHILQCVADAAVNELLHSEGLHSVVTYCQR